MLKCLLSDQDYSDKMYYGILCPAGATIYGFDLTASNDGTYGLHDMNAEVLWGSLSFTGGTTATAVAVDDPRLTPQATAKKNPTWSGSSSSSFVWRGLWVPNAAGDQQFNGSFRLPAYVPPGGMFTLYAAGPVTNHYTVDINIWFKE